MQKILKVLYKEALKAKEKGEIPVSAVIVSNGVIISKAHNSRVKTNMTMAHAEVLAILKANKKKKSWRLSDCDIYVSLKPCDMCLSIIKEARINNVFYFVDPLNFKKKYDKTNIKSISDEYPELKTNFIHMITDFFDNKR